MLQQLAVEHEWVVLNNGAINYVTREQTDNKLSTPLHNR